MITWQEILTYAHGNNPSPDIRIVATDELWAERLPHDVYEIVRGKGTERPFSSPLCSSFESGVYACVCCHTPLFDNVSKFESGTGWPSFTEPVSHHVLAYQADDSNNMERIEVTCATCDAHLGHVFNDGSRADEVRYCMNARALYLSQASQKTAVIGGGCFWCTEAIFKNLPGITSIMTGYSGGDTLFPTYDDVCTGDTGHAEVIHIVYDEEYISYKEIIDIHLQTHNPTTRNKQGTDIGTQYRSIVFYQNDDEKIIAQKSITRSQKLYNDPIVTEIKKLEVFYIAETYHQDYYAKNPNQPYCLSIIDPKIKKLTDENIL